MMKPIFAAASAATLLLAGAALAAPPASARAPAAAPARAPAAAPAQAPLTQGPPIAGLCVYSQQEAIGTSSAGKAMMTRLQQLQAQAVAELQAEGQSLKADEDALAAKRTTLSQEQLQAQVAPLQQRETALNKKAQQRDAELQATREKALGRFATAMNPIVRNLYQQHACSVLLNAEAVMAVAPAMDITPQAVQQLNTSLPTMTFDRETLPLQQAR